MHFVPINSLLDIIKALFLAVCVVLALFLWQGHYGFNISDESFLWYGVQRVLLGEIPIRDFMAYDPGRYYWSATLMGLWGDSGIVALRVVTAVFQIIGLFIGLLLIARSSPRSSLLFLLLAAVTLALWMYPRHKLFDISLSIMLVGALTYLIELPTTKRYFIIGFCVGLIAVFGRNHGVYGVISSLGVIVWLALNCEDGPGIVKALTIWMSGVLVGYLPVLIMAAGIPGFAMALWESIRFLFEVEATNLPLPVPWPWTVPFGQVSVIEAFRGVLIGLFFIAILCFGALGIIWVVWQRLRNKKVHTTLVASIFLILPYAHFAYSRAGISHLAQGIFPFLIASFVIVSTYSAALRLSLGVIITLASMLTMLPQHPGWHCYVKQSCVDYKIARDTLLVDPTTANALAMLSKLVDQFAENGRSFIVTPFWPGAYAVMERKSPMWEIYALFPRNDDFQREEIVRIENAKPGFIMVIDSPLDGREELRFSETHPLIMKYINSNYEPTTGYTHNPYFLVYIPKSATEL